MSCSGPHPLAREWPHHDGTRLPPHTCSARIALPLIVLLGAATTAGAQPFVTRASVASDGTQGNDASALAALSAEGRYVAFTSYASNLVAADTNDEADVFVRDRQSGTTTLVSLSTAGTQGNCYSWPGAISATGRFVAFNSCASNLAAGDTNSEFDVFLRDRDTDADGLFDEPGAVATTLVSVGMGSGQGERESYASAISADGRYVAFASQPTTPGAGGTVYESDVYVRDTVLGTTTCLSVATDGTKSNDDSLGPTMSTSGRFVAFTSGASNLVAGDTNNASNCDGAYTGPWLHQNCPDVFVRDRDTDNDGIFDEPGAVSTTRVSVASDGTQGDNESGVAAISGDGRYVAYHSFATNLVPGDTNGLDDLFLHDRQSGTTTKVATVAEFDRSEADIVGVSISFDGSRIAFTSWASTLTPGDTNRVVDIFVHDQVAGTTKRVSLSHDGEEADNRGYAPALSSDGAVVAWYSIATNLVPADTNDAPDVFAGMVADIVAKDTDKDGLPDSWEKRFGLKADSTADGNGADGDPDLDGVSNANEFAAGTHPRGFVARYLAEGATIAEFSTQIAILNVSDTPALVNMRYLTGAGVPSGYAMTLPPRTRRTIDCSRERGVEYAEFSTVVESDVAVVVDRTMTWSNYSSHAEAAVTGPALTWYLAEGATHSGFDLFYLLQNPSTLAADVQVTFLLASGAPVVKTYTVQPTSRFNVWVDQLAGLENTDVSAVIRVTNDVPIIVERAMYLSRGTEVFAAAHESAGVTEPATSWFLAEGNTGPFFDLFLLIANPGETDAQVRATYLLPDGSTLQKPYTVRARSRFNIWVDLEDAKLMDTAVSTTIESLNDVPIIVERAMWWPGDFSTWHEAHNSPGATTTGTMWAMAEGEVGVSPSPGGHEPQTETFVLIANTSTNAASARVTLLFEDGTSAVRTFAVNPTSRFNVWVRAEFPEAVGRRFGAIVESLGDTPAQLVVERAMYWDARYWWLPKPISVSWANGTNSLAARIK